MNSNLLKAKLAENGLTQCDAAGEIGVSLSRFNAKINAADGAEFTLGEVRALKKLLNLSADNTDEIFFG